MFEVFNLEGEIQREIASSDRLKEQCGIKVRI
jgi:hypothetical protein